MKITLYSFSILVFILSACSALMEPTPTEEPTTTPEPTFESIYLEGTLFFDKNATGLQDEATYLPCLNQRCDAVTEMEPGLKGFEVCTNINDQDYCSITQADGKFSIELPLEQDGLIHINIRNPERVLKEDEMRWINKFNDIVTIPAYTLKGKEGWNQSKEDGVLRFGDVLDPSLFYQGDIKEQTLFDTDTIPLNKGIELIIGKDNSIGLMKGMIVYPFRLEDFDLLDVKGGFDHDPSNYVIDFIGSTQTAYQTDGLYFDCPEDVNSISPFSCTYNGHNGLDYGYKGSPHGIPIFAAMDGFLVASKDSISGITVSIIPTKEGISMEPWKYLELNNNPDNFVRTTYSHCDSIAFNNYKYVYRGQLIGFIGNTGTMEVYSHLHFGANYGNLFKNRNILANSGYVKDFYAMTIPEFIHKGFNDLSVWTDWNQPIFYPIDIEID